MGVTLCISGFVSDYFMFVHYGQQFEWATEQGRLFTVTQQGQQDLTPRRIYKVTHQVAAPDRGGVCCLQLPCVSLVSPSCIVWNLEQVT